VLLALDWNGSHSELLLGRSRDCDVVLESGATEPAAGATPKPFRALSARSRQHRGNGAPGIVSTRERRLRAAAFGTGSV
jgi:hypothetical protein